MLNIIPKPYKIIDNEKRKTIDGFSVNCPIDLYDGIKLFMAEYSVFSSGKYTINIIKKQMDDSAYNLIVKQSGIVIEVSSSLGLFYATRSLKQIIEIKNNKLYISLCQIYDKPKFKYRSFSLDESRHFFGKDEVKKIIDILSLLKIRYFHWHLSDDQGFRINFKKYPKLYEIGSSRERTKIINDFGNNYDETVYKHAYEEEDIIEIINYAEERFISIIPEFDMPGHTASIVASYPYLHCLDKQIKVFDGVAGNYDIICPSKETTYEFLDGLFSEIMKLFEKSEYIHLGGDEVIPTNWSNCPHCIAKMKELGYDDPHQLQSYFSKRFISMLEKYNKKMIMWHDGIKDDTFENVILQYWTWQMDKAGIDKINQGRPTIYSPCSQVYFDSAYAELPLNRVYGRGIVLDGLTPKGRSSIFGMECCSWNEFVRDCSFLEFMIFPRIHAFAESCWTYKNKLDYDDFKLRLDYHMKYLDELGMNYCKKHLYDNEHNEMKISPIFRKYNRYVEYDQN